MDIKRKYLNSLTSRIVIPNILFIAILSFGLYFIIQNSVSGFIDNYMKENTKWATKSIYMIINSQFEYFQRSNHINDRVKMRIIQGKTLGLIEEFSQNNNLESVVYRGKEIILLTEGLRTVGEKVLEKIDPLHGVETLKIGKRRYYTSHFTFVPWKWDIAIFRDSSISRNFLEKTRTLSFVTGFLIFLGTVFLATYLGFSIKGATRKVIKALKDGTLPNYKGIYEFEFISDNIRNMMATLKDSENRKEALLNAIPDFMFVLTRDGTFLAYSSPDESRLYLKPEHFLGKKLEDVIPPEISTEAIELVSRAIDEGSIKSFEYRLPVEGVERDFEARIVPSGENEVLAIVRDITEKKESDRARQKAEEKFRTLFEDSKDVVYISTPEGKIEEINPAGLELLGFSTLEEARNINLEEDIYVNRAKREEFKSRMEKQGYVKGHPITLKNHNGEHLELIETATAERDDKGKVIAYRGIMRDVTQQKKLERQLLQAQKMDAVGRLAGGLAHDINNYLGAITGFCEMVRITQPDNEDVVNKMDEVINISFKASSLIKQLLAFSRQQPVKPEVLNLNKVTANLQGMLKRLIGEDIELDTRYCENLWNVKIDPSQIEQVLVNLLVNARDAMPSGGKLMISTDNRTIKTAMSLKRPSQKPGDFVLLSVKDTGIGIPEEIREKIFEPFFTTKGRDRGSGLGLSTIYGIIKQNNGFIWVDSDVGKGTTFEILLPACESEATISIREESIEYGGETKIGTILLVEDNHFIRESTEAILNTLGHNVLSAENGNIAMELFNEHRQQIDLLLTDIVMPGISGIELAERLQQEKKGLKVIFITGYEQSEVARRGPIEGDILFLKKPFKIKDLASAIRDAME